MMYAGVARSNKPVRIDMRSDTVTQPTAEMRAVMAAAEVGDDVYGDDPSVNALQDKAAKLLGKEAGLFVATGTQSNLCATLAHCQRGDEILVGDSYHIFRDEAGGPAVLGGVMMASLPTSPLGAMTADDVHNAVKPDDAHCAISRLLCLENTVAGNVQPQDVINQLAAAGHARGLAVHLDGARLMNAVVKLGISAAEAVASIDTVSLCLSKGLGTPAGSVLVGPRDFIRRAHRVRKLVGGGMRQIGILAAAGLYALDHHVDRLAEDHLNAVRLAEGLSKISAIQVDPAAVQTNMVFMTVPEGAADGLRSHLAETGILLGGGARQIRLVTHLDVDADAVDVLTAEIAQYFA
jgi:threonine aldolase